MDHNVNDNVKLPMEQINQTIQNKINRIEEIQNILAELTIVKSSNSNFNRY
jgi:hypothetical protein